MNVNKLKNKITAARESSIQDRLKGIENVNSIVKTSYEEIKSRLCSRVAELCDVINFAIENGYIIQDYARTTIPPCFPDDCVPRLQTDSITHKLGFYNYYHFVVGRIDLSIRFFRVGYKMNEKILDFTVDSEDVYYGNKSFSEFDYSDDYWSDDSIELLYSFSKDFEKFSSDFLTYIENIEKYKCYL